MRTKKYTIEEASRNQSKLIRDVYITVNGKLMVKVVPIADGLGRRVPGGFAGKISWTPDCFDPLTDEEMEELGFE